MQSNRFGNWLEWQRLRSRQWGRLALAYLALLVLVNVALLPPHHPHFALESIPGFSALFGLGVCVAMVLLMMGAVGKILGVSEDFHDRNR